MNNRDSDIDQPAYLRIKRPPGDVSPPADTKTQQEIADLSLKKSQDEHEKLLVQIDELKEHRKKLQLENRDLEQNIGFRRRLPTILFIFTCIWIIAVTVLIVCFSRPHGSFSDAVSIAFLGTTTVSVFAFFKCVTNYLFPSQQNQNESGKAKTNEPKQDS